MEISVITKKCKSKRVIGILLAMVCIGNFATVDKVHAVKPAMPMRVLAKRGSLEKQLLQATKRGNLHDIKRLLKAKAININAVDENGRTALHWAVIQERIAVIRVLLAEIKININARDKFNETPLHAICYIGNEEIIQMLLEINGIDVNAANEFGITPLHIAVQINIAIVRLLLAAKGIDINRRVMRELRPLDLALHYRDVEMRNGNTDAADRYEEIARILKEAALAQEQNRRYEVM